MNRRGFLRAAAAAARDAAREATAARPSLTPEQLERYSRQLLLPEWSEDAQQRLAASSVLIVGAGALGSPVSLYLAGAGVGRLGIVDGDAVELSNLHRQLLHFTPDIGTLKAHSAGTKLSLLNPEVLVETYPVRFGADNAPDLLPGHDLVVDCSDGFSTRYAVNAACVEHGVALVSGAVTGFDGLVMTIRPGETPCYRCAFPEPPPAHAETCAQAGVLGPAAGVVGSLQALEALALLSGAGEPLAGAFLQLDLRRHEVLRVSVSRRNDCRDCGV